MNDNNNNNKTAINYHRKHGLHLIMHQTIRRMNGIYQI